jgi:radical SAM superfamily enzyme with C-terminal helix-hairpin-helix motif
VTPLRVLSAGVLWRLFGRRASAETLLEAFATGSEQSRMLAGMSLVRAGERSFDLIASEIEAGQASPGVLRLLPDIDHERARDVIAPVAAGEGELAAAARECMGTLDRIEADEAQG